MITQIEQAILTRLAPLREAGLLVRALPNRSSEYGEVQGNGVITVSWAVDEVQPPNGLGAIQQNCLMLWVLDGRVRNLRDAAGLQVLRQAIYNLLIGFQPPHCKKLYARKFEFVERSENFWHFEAIFVAPTLLMEQVPEAAEALLQELVFESSEINSVPIGTESVIVP